MDPHDKQWSCEEVALAARVAEKAMSSFDASHDVFHAFRVHGLALRIAAQITQPVNMLVVELSALLHDICDSKYRSVAEGIDSECVLAATLRSEIGITDEAIVNHVVKIANGISYSKQVQNPIPTSMRTIEMDIVQDADRLESIGAIGIARCFHFGGARGHSLPDCREHFDSKLVKLISLMRTEPGRKMAEQRDAFLRAFMDQYDAEISV